MRDTSKVHYLNPIEVQRLFNAIRASKSKRDLAMFMVTFYHGLRASEVSRLTRDDLDLAALKMRINRSKRGMSGSQRLVDGEPKVLRSYMRSRKDTSPALFPSRQGNPISTEQLNVLMRKYCAEAGIPRERAHPHALRHSCGFALVEMGVDLRTIQTWLGHSAVSSTTIYTQISDPTRDRNVCEAFARQASL